MLSEKAQVMILLREASTRDCLAAALDIVTSHSRTGLPDWAAIRVAIAAMLAGVRPAPAAEFNSLSPPVRKAG